MDVTYPALQCNGCIAVEEIAEWGTHIVVQVSQFHIHYIIAKVQNISDYIILVTISEY